MTQSDHPQPGTITWWDLTVPNAAAVRDFYAQVVGWTSRDHPMGDYVDYDIRTPAGDKTVAGICHARGANADIPPQWLPYIHVEDVEGAAGRCRDAGGEVVAGPRRMGPGMFCVIRDPAGAVAALYGPASDPVS